jgi:phosphoglycolate phosphatase
MHGHMHGTAPRLVIFDVDGTLVDSQAAILAAMAEAFLRAGRPAPARAAALGVVGLSLPQAMAVLAPDAEAAQHLELARRYREAFLALRERTGGEAAMPLFPGARNTVARLDGAGILLGIATGKARRGLDHFLVTHGLKQHFVATQTADDAPSKPHPQMVLNCLALAGVEARDAVMVGDTEFDMEMARAAGCRALGVAWGYHPRRRVLAGGAERIAESFEELHAILETLWMPA